MSLKRKLHLLNKGMIAFDFALGTAALTAPAQTLRVLGHSSPSPDAEELFRRCGPIWLTFATAHSVAAARGERRDWYALAWLRATEIFTDALWARSEAVQRPGSKTMLRAAGLANLAMVLGFRELAR